MPFFIPQPLSPHLKFFLVLPLLVCLGSCNKPKASTEALQPAAPPPEAKAGGYDFSHPADIIVLPDTLDEISGITAIDSNTVACIEDENGVLFFYDFSQHTLSEYQFGANGDYEDLARVSKSIYVLRSDGVLLRIPDFQKEAKVDSAFVTFIPSENNEGLCYEPAQNRFLIACKSSVDDAADKDKRAIYMYDLRKRRLDPEPVYDFDVDSINAMARAEDLKIAVKETRKTNKAPKPPIRFRTSGIAIQPATGKLFLLSATDHMLFIFGKGNLPEKIVQLDPKLYNKPEGISFLPNGDLFISNEAENQKPTLLRFHYDPALQ